MSGLVANGVDALAGDKVAGASEERNKLGKSWGDWPPLAADPVDSLMQTQKGWSSFDGDASQMAMISQIREDQGRCTADVYGLQLRVRTLEERLLHVCRDADRAALAGRVPMLVSGPPPQPTVLVRSGSMPSFRGGPRLAARGDASAQQGDVAKDWSSEVLGLSTRIDKLEAAHSNATASLRQALDAAVLGIARVGRDLAEERKDREKLGAFSGRLGVDSAFGLPGGAMDRIIAALRTDIAVLVGDEATKVQSQLNSRIQLLVAEIRGSFQRSAAAGGRRREPGCEAGAAGSPAAAAAAAETRALHEWLPADADGDLVATKTTLAHLRVFDSMLVTGVTPEQLLSRPTVKFVHRTVVAIKHATGFPQGVLEDWPEPAEAKIDFINRVWECVASTLGLAGVEFDAGDVLRCTNRQRTRRLLQLLAIAAVKERGLQPERALMLPPTTASAAPSDVSAR
mmetsp:Transcript_143761/g.364905  ORF Transcript_143761/g.364905 Transcript_143761/m.364905 type:complete len:456 (+) Transcript_143761:99-1466(+)